jgi:hypothetical protein
VKIIINKIIRNTVNALPKRISFIFRYVIRLFVFSAHGYKPFGDCHSAHASSLWWANLYTYPENFNLPTDSENRKKDKENEMFL